MGTDFVCKSCLKTIQCTVFSLVTVCPCEQFVLENCHGASVYSLNTKDLRNPGSYLQSLVYKANGLTTAPRWLLNDTKFYVISTVSLNNRGNSSIQQNRRRNYQRHIRKTNKTRDTKCLGQATENAGSDVVIFILTIKIAESAG